MPEDGLIVRLREWSGGAAPPRRYHRERGSNVGLAPFGLIRQIEDSPLISCDFCALNPSNSLHRFGAVCAHVSPRRVPGRGCAADFGCIAAQPAELGAPICAIHLAGRANLDHPVRPAKCSGVRSIQGSDQDQRRAASGAELTQGGIDLSTS